MTEFGSETPQSERKDADCARSSSNNLATHWKALKSTSVRLPAPREPLRRPTAKASPEVSVRRLKWDYFGSRGITFKVKHLEHPRVPRSVRDMRRVSTAPTTSTYTSAAHLLAFLAGALFCSSLRQFSSAVLFGSSLRQFASSSPEFLPAYPFQRAKSCPLFCPFTVFAALNKPSASLVASHMPFDPAKLIRIFTKLAPLNVYLSVPGVLVPLTYWQTSTKF